jgi:hypothetical protein
MASDQFWYAQLAVTLAALALFGVVWVRTVVYHHHHKAEPFADHGSVVAGGLVTITLGSALISYGTAVDDIYLHDVGSVLVRGALVILAVYLLVAGPFRGRG